MNTMVLNENQLRYYAPSIYGTPSEKLSDRYTFVPTYEVLNILKHEGFVPVRAGQTGKGLHAKHMVRLRHRDYIHMPVEIDTKIPEAVLFNSHDGTTKFSVASGIFIVVCANGMVVGEKVNKQSIKHLGSAEEVANLVFETAKDVPRVFNAIEEMSAIELTPNEKGVFAKAAHALRWKENEGAAPDALIVPRRYADNKNDLWTTTSVVQENIMKGGYLGARKKVRGIKSVVEDMRLNRSLWILAEEFKQLKEAA